MNVNRVGLFFCLLACLGSASAETMYKYRVQLTDKKKTVYSLEHPEEFLSSRALVRRAHQGLAVDSTDLPVCRVYRPSEGAGGRICFFQQMEQYGTDGGAR